MELPVWNCVKPLIIDDEDWDLLKQHNVRFSLDSSGHACCYSKLWNKVTSVHKMLLNRNFDNGMDIDHIDRNPLNCRRNNLRVITHGQNMVNTVKAPGRSSKYKGVYFHKNRKRWQVYVKYNQRQMFGGTFDADKEDEAALAANELYKKYFGEFAVLNIVQPTTMVVA